MTENITAGLLNSRISVQVATETKDLANDTIQSWPEKVKLWAMSGAPRGGRETFGAQQMVREADTEWTVRRSSESLEFAPERNRVLDLATGRLFEIVHIGPHPKYADCLLMLCASRPDLRGARAPVV